MIELTCDRPWLDVALQGAHRCLSWSVNRPGFQKADHILWREVRNADLTPELDAGQWLHRQLVARGQPDAIAFLTSRDVRRHHIASQRAGDVLATAVVTLGLSNGERVGQRRGTPARVGTINILIVLNQPLSDAALVEALSIAVQARTLAVLEAEHPVPGVQGFATGTGTDCMVLAAPFRPGAHAFAGLHTDTGEAVGAAVLSACREGVGQWKIDFRAAGFSL